MERAGSSWDAFGSTREAGLLNGLLNAWPWPALKRAVAVWGAHSVSTESVSKDAPKASSTHVQGRAAHWQEA